MTLFSTQFAHSFVSKALQAGLFFAAKPTNDLHLPGERGFVKAAKQGDPEAFTDLYNHYFPKIYSFIMRRTGHQQTAEDLTSKVFLKAFHKLPTFTITAAPFGAWLFRIASNTVTDHYRKASNNKEFASAQLPEQPDKSLDTAKLVISEEAKEQVLGLIAELPNKDQKIIELRFLAELSVKEISAIVELSPNVISVRIYRAVKKLSSLAQKKGYETS
jgi:RNA polymerase sigma-70 factor, ECF subfamily